MKHKFKMKQKLAAGALAVGLMTAGSLQAGAATITVLNPSFEDNDSGAPVDWVASGTGYTYVRQTNYAVKAYAGDNLDQIGAYPYTGTPITESLSQTISLTSYTPEAGDELTLTVAGENEATSLTPSNNIELTLGGAVIADDSSFFPTFKLDPVTHQELLTPETLNYTITSADLLAHPGAALGIEIAGANTQLLVDDVQLSVIPAEVPEPSAWAMMLAGLVSLVGLRRFARQS